MAFGMAKVRNGNATQQRAYKKPWKTSPTQVLAPLNKLIASATDYAGNTHDRSAVEDAASHTKEVLDQLLQTAREYVDLQKGKTECTSSPDRDRNNDSPRFPPFSPNRAGCFAQAHKEMRLLLGKEGALRMRV
jgi:hypothetical protein